MKMGCRERQRISSLTGAPAPRAGGAGERPHRQRDSAVVNQASGALEDSVAPLTLRNETHG